MRLKTAGDGRPRRQAGFTLISTAMGFMVAAVCITGAWIGYGGMQIQWKLSTADRMMDQYAHSALQDLTNVVTWSWGAHQVQGGSRNERWQFYMDDIIDEHGSHWNDYPYRPDLGHLLTVTHDSRRGILINNRPSLWNVDARGGDWYQWSGRRAGINRINQFDHRDRMTIEGVLYDFNDFSRYPRPADAVAQVKRRGVLEVTLTMHYRYSAGNWRSGGPRLYGDSYVRERLFKTQIAMRNWDAAGNPYREQMIADAGG